MPCPRLNASQALSRLSEAIDRLNAAAVKCMVACQNCDNWRSICITASIPLWPESDIKLAELAPRTQWFNWWRLVSLKQSWPFDVELILLLLLLVL